MQKAVLLPVFTLLSFLSFAQIERKVTTMQKTDSVSTAPVMPAAGNNERKQLMQELNLTKEQRAKLREIHQSGKAGKEAIENDNTLTDADKQVKLKALQKEQFQRTLDILNKEQQQKMRNSRATMRTSKQTRPAINE